jgi:prepilin-type N-terminal cleavage/methylation domain-containing protein
MRKAFTLAEVLITLGIIGIVAALTMPSLVADYKKKVAITRLKKFYSVHMQSYNMLSVNEDTRPIPTVESIRNPDYAMEMLEYRYKPYVKNLNIAKKNQGAVISFSDGSGVYFRKSGFIADEPDHSENYSFCVDYKKCMELDETKTIEDITDGKNTFVFDTQAASFAWLEDRELIKAYCKNSKTGGCAAIIIMDGWEIKDDYPW